MTTPPYFRNIPIYRKYQFTMISPCLLGTACPGCVLHLSCLSGHPCGMCRRSEPHECLRNPVPAPPAFYMTFRGARALIDHGLARFIHHNTALQLTFSTVEKIRGRSCDINEGIIIGYILGWPPARLAVELGWSTPPKSKTRRCPTPTMYPFV